MQIAKLTPGAKVVLDFAGKYTEEAEFVRLTGEGEDRTATFRSKSHRDGSEYDWDAYRVNNRWVFGSSAQRLSLVAIARHVSLEV